MDSLKLLFSNKKILKFKKGWEKIGLWISLDDFFSSKKILKFKKGWEKIGLWIPLFVFFKKKCFFFRLWFYMNLLNDLFSQRRNLKIQKRLGEDRIVDSLKRFFFQIRKF